MNILSTLPAGKNYSCLIIFSGHGRLDDIQTLRYTKLHFLPLNTTSKLKPTNGCRDNSHHLSLDMINNSLEILSCYAIKPLPSLTMLGNCSLSSGRRRRKYGRELQRSFHKKIACWYHTECLLHHGPPQSPQPMTNIIVKIDELLSSTLPVSEERIDVNTSLNPDHKSIFEILSTGIA